MAINYREECKVSRSGWSRWVRAIIPELPYHGRMKPWYEKRSSRQTGYICTNIRKAFDGDNCGIYEWKAVNKVGKNSHVVYIGSTCRSKPGALESRILEYCTNGSHKATEINRALRRGNEMWVRVKEIEGAEEEAEKAENEMLNTYNYAWNRRQNRPYRGRDVPPPV